MCDFFNKLGKYFFNASFVDLCPFLISNDFCWGTPGLTGSCHIHMMDRVAANDKTFFGRLTLNHFHGPNLLTQSNALATVITLH